MLTITVLSTASSQAAIKKLLVVTTTTGFRHDTIPIAETVLAELGAQSGAFTVDYLRQPAGKPNAPRKPGALKDSATTDEKQAFDAATEKYRAADAAYRIADAQWTETLKESLTKLSPAALARYDGTIFASTSGDLPIPDKAGFLEWIKSGKAFIGIHAASDTFHNWPEFIDMLGAEFKGHGPQVGVECLNADPQHPATKHLPASWKIDQEEVYQFVKYDPSRVRELLALDKHPNDKTPGHYPLAWTRDYGAGRVFYTALGHRLDFWNPDPALRDRKNPPETAAAYRAHLLGGILWALQINAPDGAKPADQKPPSAPATSPTTSPATSSVPSPATAAPVVAPVDPAQWRSLLDEKLTAWELWMGSPHVTVDGLPEGTAKSANARGAPAMGLGNDPKRIFTTEIESGEPVVHITGEIWGGLTTLESFSNYHLQVDVKWGERKWEPRLNLPRNSGVLYHCTGPHGGFWNTWKRSLEFEVVEKEMGDLYLLGGTRAEVPVKRVGNLWVYDPAGETKAFGAGVTERGFGRAAHRPGDFEKPNGEWNTLDLYTIGRTSVALVNGHVAMVIRQAANIEGPEKKETPLEAGQLQLQSESAEVYYRRIRIRPITEYPVEIKQAAGL
ncbi:MAG: ThuA domain-containing protein [Burkholderiales bacterium]|nr:ThuA domain-containing protein [Phycisphaerae bacterium]